MGIKKSNVYFYYRNKENFHLDHGPDLVEVFYLVVNSGS